MQLLSNADKIPPSHKDSRGKQRQRARASGDKRRSLPWTPCFETLAKLTEVIVVIWLDNKIHSLFLNSAVSSVGFLSSFCVNNVTAQFLLMGIHDDTVGQKCTGIQRGLKWL